jgi:intracellular sulfur oxidation DsrE/DsrF family protein
MKPHAAPEPAMIRIAAIALAAAIVLASPARAEPPAGLVIDENVVLKEAKIVMNLDHLAFDGETPFGLVYMKLMLERFAADGTDWKIVGIFHGPAGYMALNDEAYNRVRKTDSGNPYKDEIAALQKGGIDIEECGQTMKEHGWTNAELLPGVRVNSGANFRIIQLVQDGFVQIQP